MSTPADRPVPPQAVLDGFKQAMKAFDLFTMSERLRALHVFAGLQYPFIEDRFHEAVYRVITEIKRD
jgi:hypothetical protein